MSGYGYRLPRDFTVISIKLQASDGSSSRPVQIQKNGSSVFEFNVIDLDYTNTELNIDFSKDDTIQVFAKQQRGKPLKNVVCLIEIAWRYTG